MWRQKLATFIGQYNHPGWGIAHSERVYELALELTKQQETDVDQDALLAAAYLHDVGALEPYRQEGVDHAERSAAIAEEMLLSVGFPTNKIPLVKEIILGHTVNAPPPTSTEAIVFRDADFLDFLGAIGVTRMLAIVGIEDWTPDLKKAVSLIQRRCQELPGKLLTRPAKRIGKVRQAEMLSFLAALSNETDKLENL
jgi:uncharacterized protein